MNYVLDIQDENTLNQFRDIVKKNGNDENKIIVKLMENYIKQENEMEKAMEIVKQKMIQHKDVLIRMRDK